MGLKTWTAVAVAVLGVAYFMYHEPPLTANLLAWRNGGKFYKHNGYDIFYRVEEGKKDDGSTLLCLHGFPTSSFDYTKILGGLKEHFSKIVLYDYLGFGLSDKPTSHSYTIMEQADIGAAILLELGINKVHVLAHDYGDTVALELLARHNTNKVKIPYIESLCLTNGGIFPETNFPRPLQKILLTPILGPFIAGLTNFIIIFRGFGDVFGPETCPNEDEMWDFYVTILHKRGYTINHKLLQYIPERTKYNTRWVGALVNAQTKVHTIFGPLDPVNPASFINFYKKTVPQHGITVLSPKIGHYPQWEAPGEVLKAYSEFIGTVKSS